MAYKRGFKERIWVLTKAKFEFLLIIISGFGFGIVSYLITLPNVSNWVAVSVAVVLIIVINLLILFREERLAVTMQAEEIQKQNDTVIKTLQKRVDAELKDASMNMMDRAISYATKSLRSVTDELRGYAKVVHKRRVSSTEDFIFLKNRMLRYVCQDIRSVFEGDTRGVDTTTWPHNFFKVALFEPVPAPPLTASTLRRTFFAYPEGIEPSPLTSVVDIKHHSRAAHVLAFLEQNIVVIENIKHENKKPREEKRWANLRENQAEEYESMVCVPIVSGIRGQPTRQCLGVLVIDTNRERYFLEQRFFQAFLGNILNPFRTILTFVLELETCYPNLRKIG